MIRYLNNRPVRSTTTKGTGYEHQETSRRLVFSTDLKLMVSALAFMVFVLFIR